MKTEADTDGPQLHPHNSIVIGRQREPRYWSENEDAEGHWVSNAQPGPPVTVVVTPTGIRVHGNTAELRPGVARWLALRIAEAAGIYEAVFGGDGSIAADRGRARQIPLQAEARARDLRAEPTKKYLCGCGKSSSNRGGMVVHERTCPHGPITEVITL